MGVSTGCASVCPKLETMRSINADWDKEMVRRGLSQDMAMPRANLAPSRSDIFHLLQRSALNRSFSAALLAMETMSLT
jgi:hypothetical protein